MSLKNPLLTHSRLIYSTAVMWVLAGVMTWRVMPRQEDPALPRTWGMIIAPFPGADAETVERLVVDPIEEKLMEIDRIKTVSSVSRTDAGIINIELLGTVKDTDTQSAWDEVRRAVTAVQTDLPEEAGVPVLDERLSDQESIVLAVTGSNDKLVLKDTAEKLKRQLMGIVSVSKIKIVADPKEQITIAMEDATMRRLGIDPSSLLGRLREQNRLIPGGSVKVGEKEISLRPGSDFKNVEEIRQTPVLLPSGASVPLGAVATVERCPASPVSEMMWHNGVPSVGLGIIPKADINMVAFGNDVREAVARFNQHAAPLRVDIIADQPAQVENRISQLTNSLMLSISVVALLLFLFMDVRLSVTVATVIPMVVFSGIAVFGWMNGSLHQVSIAALVIALGMLVDNAVVVTEGIQERLDRGIDADSAATQTVRELVRPLGSATGTTIAAFVPMLLAKGPTADFTKSIPLVIILTLSASYVFAITVTPLLAKRLLRPRTEQSGRGAVRRRLLQWVSRSAASHPMMILLIALVLVAASFASAKHVTRRFFPNSDRSLMLVAVSLPEGTHIDTTARTVERLMSALRKRSEMVSVSGFAGRSAPHFYYNIMSRPNSPQLGQLVIRTRKTEDLGPLSDWLMREGQRAVPEADLTASPLEQGPPVAAPIEVRLFGDDLQQLEIAAQSVQNLLKRMSGTRDVRHGLGMGAPIVDFDVHEAAAGRLSLSRKDVAVALLRTTRGLSAGPLRSEDDPVPILLCAPLGEHTDVSALAAVDAAAPGRPAAPLIQAALPSVQWMPAALHHRDRKRMTSITAHLQPGTVFSEVMDRVQPEIDRLHLEEAGIGVQYGGELEGSEEADGAMMAAMPIGLILLLAVLLFEFPSFRKVGIIFITVPLAAVGVIPGLLLSGQPFGFMSVLGVFALVGIVVNNAIILLDAVARFEEEGLPRKEAVKRSVERRFRPIFLTTGTTIVGLLPLALSSTTLWPPLAFAMISGLAVSSLLTLLVVPALYLILFPSSLQKTDSLSPAVV